MYCNTLLLGMTGKWTGTFHGEATELYIYIYVELSNLVHGNRVYSKIAGNLCYFLIEKILIQVLHIFIIP